MARLRAVKLVCDQAATCGGVRFPRAMAVQASKYYSCNYYSLQVYHWLYMIDAKRNPLP